MTRTHLALVAFVVAVLISAPVRAQGGDPARAEAAERFDRALHLVDAGDLSGGLAEFQRAYALVPSPVVLYNLGLVNAWLNRPVASVRALESALKTPQSLKPEYVTRARQVLAEQSEKIGQVDLTTNVKEGVVEVDNVETAKLPLPAPIDVAVGSHVVAVVSPGYAPARQAVLVAGHQRVEAHLELVAIEGRLAHIGISSNVPAADVSVDGERVGKTPLDATVTVPPGPHHVAVARRGYRTAERDITLQDGAQADLTLQPLVDKGALGSEGGSLAIAASETQVVVSIDGEEAGVLGGPIELPAGPHRLRLERGGFVAAERDVEVPLGRTATVDVTLEPNPETRAKYVSSAESRRTWSWVTIGGGVALAAGGTVLAIVEHGQLPDAQAKLNAVNADFVRFSGRPCDLAHQISPAQQTSCVNRLNDATDRVNNIQTLTTVGWVIAGAGAAVTITGVVLLLTGDDPHRYDEKRPPEHVLGGIGPWRLLPQVGGGAVSLSLTRAF
jgi:hypothetical protein